MRRRPVDAIDDGSGNITIVDGNGNKMTQAAIDKMASDALAESNCWKAMTPAQKHKQLNKLKGQKK